MALGMAIFAAMIMLLLMALMWYSWYGREYDAITVPETVRPDDIGFTAVCTTFPTAPSNSETGGQYPPYPTTIPLGMPAPPEGYLTSTIPVISMNEPRSASPGCAAGFIDTTDLPPSYDEVVKKK